MAELKNEIFKFDEEKAEKFMTETLNFLETLFPIESERNEILEYLAKAVRGKANFKNFLVLTGKQNGNQGKYAFSVLLKTLFGSSMVISNKILNKNQGNFHLAQVCEKSLLFHNAMEKNVPIDVILLKHLLSGSENLERRMFERTPRSLIWRTGIVMMIDENHEPFSFDDEALKTRMIKVPLRSRFVNEAVNFEKFIFKRDDRVHENIPLMRSSVLKLLSKF